MLDMSSGIGRPSFIIENYDQIIYYILDLISVLSAFTSLTIVKCFIIHFQSLTFIKRNDFSRKTLSYVIKKCDSF